MTIGIIRLLFVTGLALVLLGCESKGPPEMFAHAPAMIKLISPEFEAGTSMPAHISCQGQEESPALSWSSVPANAKSLVILMMDYDAPSPKFAPMPFTHWVLFNIPAELKGLPAKLDLQEVEGLGAEIGTGSLFKKGYLGPCPPLGVHRYYFHLYALDVLLRDLGQHPSRSKLLKAMQGHVLAQGTLMGTYKKQ